MLFCLDTGDHSKPGARLNSFNLEFPLVLMVSINLNIFKSEIQRRS